MNSHATPAVTWPTALVPCLRHLWGRILFNGREPIDTSLRTKSLWAVILLPALMLYPWVSFRLLEPDEGRYAEIPREMLVAGEYIVPLLQGEAYLDKPPLLYWLVMASYRIFGIHDWAARLVPALAVHLTIIATFLGGRRIVGERSALFAAILASLSPALIGMGRLLNLDGLLTMWVTIGLLLGYQRAGSKVAWGWPCAIACALGVLTKGPVALILVLGPLVIHHWLATGRFEFRARPWLWFFSIVIAVNLPWYLAVWRARPEFGFYFFIKHNLLRFLAPFDHLEPVWYYLPVTLGGLMPATFLLWGFGKRLLSGSERDANWRTPGLGFALLAGGWCLAFFSMSGSKLPTYILPAFPMLYLAIGHYAATEQAPARSTRFRNLAIGWGLLLLAANAVVIPWYAWQRSPLGHSEGIVRELCSDPSVAVRSYPRNIDSAGFYLQRDDIQSTRSKFANLLVADLRTRPKTVVLFTHRHSLEAFKYALPADLKIVREQTFRQTVRGPAWLKNLIGDSPWGLCDLAVIESASH